MKFRNFIRSVKKATPEVAYEKINEVKKGASKAPKSKTVEIKVNKIEGGSVIPSNDEVIVETIKSKITELLEEGNSEKLLKVYDFLKAL